MTRGGGSGFGARFWAVVDTEGGASLRSRARGAARRRRVDRFALEEGRIDARVRDLDPPQSFGVSVEVPVIEASQFESLLLRVSRDPLLVSSLHAGEVPAELERHCVALHLELFPRDPDSILARCECGVTGTPCEHVCLALAHFAEGVERDPGLMFTLRGLGADRFQRWLDRPMEADPSDPVTEEASAVPLPSDAALFWAGPPPSEDLLLPVPASEDEPSLLDTLANFPFWRSEEPFVPTLERIYRAVRRTGLGVLAGEC